MPATSVRRKGRAPWGLALPVTVGGKGRVDVLIYCTQPMSPCSLPSGSASLTFLQPLSLSVRVVLLPRLISRYAVNMSDLVPALPTTSVRRMGRVPRGLAMSVTVGRNGRDHPSPATCIQTHKPNSGLVTELHKPSRPQYSSINCDLTYVIYLVRYLFVS